MKIKETEECACDKPDIKERHPEGRFQAVFVDHLS